MHPSLTIAKRAAYAAGKIIIRGYDQRDQLKPQQKSANDYVSQVDLAADKIIVETLIEAFPEYQILSEEGGLHETPKNKHSEYKWVIDPLDGTTNFLRGYPHFAVSIALLHKNKPVAGLVYNPLTDEMFCASTGDGATLNDRKIRVAKMPQENAILATGFPFRHPELMPTQQAILRDSLSIFPDLRRSGSAALDLCYVASARVDAYFELALNQWDIAAGALIAQESGAIVSDMNGELTHLQTGNICAAPPKIYKNLVKITRKHLH